MYCLLPPANGVWGKVIFSVACVKNSVHRGGSTWAGTSPGQVHPLGRYTPLSRYTPLGRYTPRQVHLLGRYTPQQVHHPGRYTPSQAGTPHSQAGTALPRQVHPFPGRYTPWAGKPPPQEQCMLGDTGNKRAVHILLECILVHL